MHVSVTLAMGHAGEHGVTSMVDVILRCIRREQIG